MPTQQPHVRLSFLPATQADFDCLYRLCEATMRGYVEADLGDCFDRIAKTTLTDLIARDLFSKVYANGTFVGAVAVEQHADHCQLEELYIAPAFQNRGLGAAVMRHVMAQAKAQRKPVRLHVLASNRARVFYERLGFVVTQTGKAVNHLAWIA
jgi:ribosomal protein S18 acetylase RimI-like enzyme